MLHRKKNFAPQHFGEKKNSFVFRTLLSNPAILLEIGGRLGQLVLHMRLQKIFDI